jgi:hypothetical protein
MNTNTLNRVRAPNAIKVPVRTAHRYPKAKANACHKAEGQTGAVTEIDSDATGRKQDDMPCFESQPA